MAPGNLIHVACYWSTMSINVLSSLLLKNMLQTAKLTFINQIFFLDRWFVCTCIQTQMEEGHENHILHTILVNTDCGREKEIKAEYELRHTV